MDFLVLFVLFVLFFISNVLIISYSHQLESVSIEKWGHRFRKYSHLVGGFVMLLFAVLSTIQLSWICFSIFVCFVIHEYFYVKQHIFSIYTTTLIFIGRLDRRYDPESSSPKPFYPTLWLLAGIAIIGLFGKFVAIAAILTFALGDGFSTIVGKRIGKHKLPYNKTKSIEGSIVFFLASFLGVFGIYILAGYWHWLPALVSALVGSVIESAIPSNFWLDDNFAVPVGVGVVLYFTKIL